MLGGIGGWLVVGRGLTAEVLILVVVSNNWEAGSSYKDDWAKYGHVRDVASVLQNSRPPSLLVTLWLTQNPHC